MKKAISLFVLVFLSSCSPADVAPETQIQITESVDCIEVFSPVCGLLELNCPSPTCEKIRQTFSNRCYAEKAGAINILDGEC